MPAPATAPLGRFLAPKLLAFSLLFPTAARVGADDPPKPDSPLVKLLKGGRIPSERQGSVLDMIGKRGTAADLDYLFERALQPAALTLPNRLKALDALAEAAQTRNLRPTADLGRLAPLFAHDDPATSLAAVRLAGLWKSEALGGPLGKLAADSHAAPEARAGALGALASLGGAAGRSRVEALTGPDQPSAVRAQALAALARLDAAAAAPRAAEFLAAGSPSQDVVTPLVAAFLNLHGGSDKLAAALGRVKLGADPAKVALRAVYALGRSDPALTAALTAAAGMTAEARPLDPAEMQRLITDVAAHGDPARGEQVFRRADVNCFKCHALSGAGGSVGPDLSPVGSTSPVDYLVNSIMLPDQAVKEAYLTLTVQTTDGQVFQGVVEDRDARRIVLKEATGARRVIAASDVEDSKEGGSLMPKGLVNFMTRAEFVDLVRFLSELGKPGPYAVRTAPTVQRWRVLKSAGPPPAGTPPDPEAFESEILKTPADRWLPAYGKVGGDLPLAEASDAAGSKLVYLQAEVEVSRAGAALVKLNAAEGVHAWLDETPIPPFQNNAAPIDLKTGRHKLTFRVDTAARREGALRAEVARAPGSPVELVVTGGP